jgi:hypothetical protein
VKVDVEALSESFTINWKVGQNQQEFVLLVYSGKWLQNTSCRVLFKRK